MLVSVWWKFRNNINNLSIWTQAIYRRSWLTLLWIFGICFWNSNPLAIGEIVSGVFLISMSLFNYNLTIFCMTLGCSNRICNWLNWKSLSINVNCALIWVEMEWMIWSQCEDFREKKGEGQPSMPRQEFDLSLSPMAYQTNVVYVERTGYKWIRLYP